MYQNIKNPFENLFQKIEQEQPTEPITAESESNNPFAKLFELCEKERKEEAPERLNRQANELLEKQLEKNAIDIAVNKFTLEQGRPPEFLEYCELALNLDTPKGVAEKTIKQLEVDSEKAKRDYALLADSNLMLAGKLPKHQTVKEYLELGVNVPESILNLNEDIQLIKSGEAPKHNPLSVLLDKAVISMSEVPKEVYEKAAEAE